jgi:protein-S-isoprenylcysteine O-methyltransferase Ste14
MKRTTSYVLRVLARWAILTFCMSLLLFVVAGTMCLPSLRNYLVTFSTLLLVTMLLIDPGLAEERSRISDAGGSAERFVAGLAFLTTLALAALDIGRLHWFRRVPDDLRLGSLLLVTAASTLQMWTMVVNPFFSPEIRLQPERGQRLISRGPYRLVRHPGYLAMLVFVPASALAIGSWLALVPAAAFCLVIVRRVGAEELFLQKNLAGYAEYMDRVRDRLLPPMFNRCRPRQHSFSRKFASYALDRRWP